MLYTIATANSAWIAVKAGRRYLWRSTLQRTRPAQLRSHANLRGKLTGPGCGASTFVIGDSFVQRLQGGRRERVAVDFPGIDPFEHPCHSVKDVGRFEVE